MARIFGCQLSQTDVSAFIGFDKAYNSASVFFFGFVCNPLDFILQNGYLTQSLGYFKI